MAKEDETRSATETKPEEREERDIGIPTPALNTTMFSDFLESVQAKASDLQEQLQNLDGDELVSNASESSKGLVDNFLAGDWLNRGELYGAMQLALVFLLLRGPNLFDALIGLLTGPFLVLSGAFVSGKALTDLGIKNLSMWPAPVPGGKLKTGGFYEIVRHPIYTGLLMASTGFAVGTGSPSRLGVVVALAVLLIKKIAVEETFLLDTYPEYGDYIEKVPYRIIPRIY